MKRTACILAAVLIWGALRGGAAGDAGGGEGYINFSFDQVDVGTFVKLVGDLTGRKFALAEGVTGKITVVSPKITRDEVYPLFLSILESVGCSVVRDGELHRVVPLPAHESMLATIVGPDEAVTADGLVTKVFRLDHVPAAEVRQVLEAGIRGGKTGAVGAIEESNHLIVTDTASSIRRVARLVEEIDRPGLARAAEVVPLRFAGADALAEELNLAVAQVESRGERLRRRLPSGGAAEGNAPPTVVASPHSNSLILVGSASQIEMLKGIIAKMDVDAPSARGRLNAIFLKYMGAEEAAESIGQLLQAAGEKTDGGAERRAIAIQASPANNALLVDASPGDFEIVKRLVDQLDRVQQQVHIAVLIAEHSIGDDLTLGVQMAAVDLPGEEGDITAQGGSLFEGGTDSLMATIQQGLFPRGITVGVAHGTRVDNEGNVVLGYPGVINIEAIKQDARFKVLSETSLEVQNNREASVSIVNDIPILKSTVQGSGSDRDFIQNIERMEVGIKLKLTPQIIPGGEVRMELNPSIEAVIDQGSSATEFTPTIARREVSTTVTVPDRRMIVIAGLTREDSNRTERRVPVLGSLPLLGWLFRYTADRSEKVNLLIFVTPRIVAGPEDADAVAREWQRKTGLSPFGRDADDEAP
ncbi:MAG: type II secretion system secretin GspD [Lentisphaerae bacterium]|nr:type II secretion system secretin GspD [Lentisphaerota bacterium]